MMVSEEDLLVNGEYYVTQTADNGCESEAAMIMVNIVDSPAPTISSDYELCAFDNPTLADLTAEINETGEVTWYESADSMTALSNNAMLTDGTTYYATLISDNGCESSERLAVTVTLEDCALLFPEAITPNGDGRNDRLVIENIESEYPNYNITIFNRWGNAVYKGNASTPTWDGTSNQSGSLGDDVLPVGVYFYVVDFNDGSTEPRQGKVYLNR
jgi:gliding motility-associated-like protein